MPVPSQEDLDKQAKKREQYQRVLDESGRIPETKLVQMIRSSLRQTWMHSPVKLLKLNLNRVPDMNPKTRTKWLQPCAHCGEMFKEADVQVDHIHGNHSFTKIEDFESYHENILDVTLDDLQVLCIQCHELKTYMEDNPHLTKEDAWKAKAVLAWFRKYPKAGQQKKKLSIYGYTGADIANEEKRKAIVLQLVEQGVVKW